MAGYSGKTLVQKLGIKPSHFIALVGAPVGFTRELGKLPDDVEVVATGRRALDFVLLFSPDLAFLSKEFPTWSKRLTPAGMLWVAWPKQSSKIAIDLNENVVREIGLKVGLVDVKVCAINEVWSGLKFVRRLVDR